MGFFFKLTKPTTQSLLHDNGYNTNNAHFIYIIKEQSGRIKSSRGRCLFYLKKNVKGLTTEALQCLMYKKV